MAPQNKKSPAEQTQFQTAVNKFYTNNLTPVFGFLAVFSGMEFLVATR